MKNSRYAFSMIELIFVIVILGILSAVAIPKLAANRMDAQIVKARSDVASIRSSIATERQTRLIKGDSDFISGLSQNSTTLFDGNDSDHTLLLYGLAAGTENGRWENTDGSPYKKYKFHVNDLAIAFEYNSTNGKFDCIDNNSGEEDKLCKRLVN